MNIVTLYSGGLDSTTLLFDLKLGHLENVEALIINYGQRHIREVKGAVQICDTYGIPYYVLDASAIGDLLHNNVLTRHASSVPEGHYQDKIMRATAVPGRNMIFLACAIGRAASLKYEAVAIAVHTGDHAIYPDCRPEFIGAMRRVAALCHYDPVEIITPYTGMTKADIVRKGVTFSVPYDLTWSCYKGGGKHCGKCGTCVERKEAFQLAGVSDPTIYEDM